MRLLVSLKKVFVLPAKYHPDTKEAHEMRQRYLEGCHRSLSRELASVIDEGWVIERFPNSICLEVWGPIAARLARFDEVLFVKELKEPRTPTTAAET